MNLSKQEKEILIHKFQQYSLSEWGEDMGDLRAMLFIEYMEKEMGVIFYNKGIEDAQGYLEEKIEDLYGLKRTV